jgi:hypothetical protein
MAVQTAGRLFGASTVSPDLLGMQSRLALHRLGVYNAPLSGVAARPAEEKGRLFFLFAEQSSVSQPLTA